MIFPIPLCECGHVWRPGHYLYNRWSEPCAEFNEVGCACIQFIPKKDKPDECVCNHIVYGHKFQETSVAYCEGFVLIPCSCENYRPKKSCRVVAYACAEESPIDIETIRNRPAEVLV